MNLKKRKLIIKTCDINEFVWKSPRATEATMNQKLQNHKRVN